MFGFGDSGALPVVEGVCPLFPENSELCFCFPGRENNYVLISKQSQSTRDREASKAVVLDLLNTASP